MKMGVPHFSHASCLLPCFFQNASMKRTSLVICYAAIAIAACAPAPTPVPAATTPTVMRRATATLVVTPEPTPDTRIQIRLWYAGNAAGRDAQRPLALLTDKFNAGHSDIQVVPIHQGTDSDLARKIAAPPIGDDAPDLILAYPTDLAQLIKSGTLAALDGPQFLTPDDLKDPFPAFIDKYPQYGNRIYSIGFARNLRVMYYNSDLLKSAGVKLPETWDDMAKACAAIAKLPETQCFESDPNALDYESAVLGRGGALISGDGKRVMFDQKPGADSLQFISDTFKNKYAAFTTRAFQQQIDFAAGKLAFTFDTTVALPLYSKSIANAGKNFSWTVAVPPRTATPIVMAYGPSLAILKKPLAKQQAGLVFVKWMMDKEANSDWVLATNTFPARAATKDNLSDYLKLNPAYGTAFAWLRLARAEPAIAAWPQVRGIIADAIVATANGKVLPSDALKDAATKANSALGQ
jgi:multiple sugar transport system substrate-binding protein